MSVTIDATVAGHSANSYITLADAETYFEKKLYTQGWDALTTDEKNTTLVEAAREIDTYLRFRGERYHNETYGDEDRQALQFPRDYYIGGSADVDGELYIPDEVKEAQCEQALHITSRGVEHTDKDDFTNDAVVPAIVKNLLKLHIDNSIVKTGNAPWLQ